ncbi:DUF389 domain-containing protein [Conexibacter woesei]|uniref:DUF389 domain-containing protein n=1 Tax=Conexibacter woesei TaxID=191495 RepID=UPI0003F6812F|nr:DUF389 domain-containing protein [Conexibacter woesei]
MTTGDEAGAVAPGAGAGAGWRRRVLTGELRSEDEIRDAVFLFSGDVFAKQSRFWLLLMVSAVIATAGIIGDSTATVIGAMIVAPLGTPIQGIAAGIADGDGRQLGLSAALVVGAGVAVILLAALMAVVLPELHAPADNSQITARVSPTIVDLVAAAATGMAGAFAVSRRDIGDILPGVAIAISLVPPLAVVGVTAVEGDWHGALGALLLFATNVLAIVVVGTVVFGAVAGLRGEARPRRAYAVVGLAAVVVVGALAAVTTQTVRLSNWRDAGGRIAASWAREHGERLLQTRFEGDQLVFVVEGRGTAADDAQLPGRLGGTIPAGTTVVVNRVDGNRHGAGTVP